MTPAKNVLESFRDVAQDLLVPELKAVKIRAKLCVGTQGIQDVKDSIESLRIEMKLRDDKRKQAMRHLSEKLDFAIDVRERLASIEARLPRQ